MGVGGGWEDIAGLCIAVCSAAAALLSFLSARRKNVREERKEARDDDHLLRADQLALIDQLKGMNADLQARVDRLEGRIAALEERRSADHVLIAWLWNIVNRLLAVMRAHDVPVPADIDQELRDHRPVPEGDPL